MKLVAPSESATLRSLLCVANNGLRALHALAILLEQPKAPKLLELAAAP